MSASGKKEKPLFPNFRKKGKTAFSKFPKPEKRRSGDAWNTGLKSPAPRNSTETRKKGKTAFSKFPGGGRGDAARKVEGKTMSHNVMQTSAKDGRKNPISKEIVGEGVSRQHLPPSLHGDSPTQFPAGAVSLAMDWNGRNPPTVTAQERRIAVGGDGRPRLYEPPALKKARRDFCAMLERHAPDAPFEGPVELRVEWLYCRADGRTGWKDTRPDTDNLQKLLKDCMTRCRYWLDDAQVAREVVEKRWVEAKPGVRVAVAPLSGEEGAE